jgi:hypothetical protein
MPSNSLTFSKRKASPEKGQRANWVRVAITPFPASEKYVAQQCGGRLRSIRVEYEKLRTDSQRGAIDHVVEEARRQEANPFAEWNLCYVRPKRKEIPGAFGPYRGTETTEIYIILKRKPRTSSPPVPNTSSWTGPVMVGS